jgi:hypothetical protein
MADAGEKTAVHLFEGQRVLLGPAGVKLVADLKIGDILLGADGAGVRVVGFEEVALKAYPVSVGTGEKLLVGPEFGVTIKEKLTPISSVSESKEDLRPSVSYTPCFYEAQQTPLGAMLAGIKHGGTEAELPPEYLFNDVEFRSQLLRGILSKSKVKESAPPPGKKHNDSMMLYIPQRRASLSVSATADVEFPRPRAQLVFLARSLGYPTAVKKSVVTITGNVNKVPEAPEIVRSAVAVGSPVDGLMMRVQLSRPIGIVLDSCLLIVSTKLA